jgi:hypothetical protein
MSDKALSDQAELLRDAVDSHDLRRAERALDNYIACFRSAPRTRGEIEGARALLNWSIERTRMYRARILDFLHAYGPTRLKHTWHVEA